MSLILKVLFHNRRNQAGSEQPGIVWKMAIKTEMVVGSGNSLVVGTGNS